MFSDQKRETIYSAPNIEIAGICETLKVIKVIEARRSAKKKMKS